MLLINLLTALLLSLPYTLHGPGALSYTPVLEQVAERRIRNDWGLTGPLDSAVLVAVADCGQLGRRGWLLTDGGAIHSIVVVDCESGEHAGMMERRGLLADVSAEGLANMRAWMVVR